MPKETAWHGAAYLYVELSCLSMVWSLPQLDLEMVDTTLLGLLIIVLAPLVATGELPQEPISVWSHSADMAVLITHTYILSVSP